MKTNPKPCLTLAEIFQKHIGEYLKIHHVNQQQQRAINDILRCQTADCGMHANVCTDCGAIDISYNSCRNRHCPNCQQAQKNKWIERQKKELLPVKYFHLVFTLPHQLNALFLLNKEICYNTLFENVWKTISHFSQNPQWLGALSGCIALLHTWGQNMSFHPHIHCIMPAGGLTEAGFEWIHTREKFFAPVGEMSEKFKTEFLKSLSTKKDQLALPVSALEWEQLMRQLQTINWVVFAQASFNSPDYVIDYLGNYTHKIAISNHRLIKLENDYVYFHWKDYKDKGIKKVMRLPVLEFIRRFLEHVLPYNFYKIRHYGILSNRFKTDNIAKAKAALAKEGKTIKSIELPSENSEEPYPNCPHMGVCKHCGGGLISLYHYHNMLIESQMLSQTG